MKKVTYVFEDYRKNATDVQKKVIDNKKDAEHFYKILTEQGFEVFNFGIERIIFPAERQGERIVTYGIYDVCNLPSLA